MKMSAAARKKSVNTQKTKAGERWFKKVKEKFGNTLDYSITVYNGTGNKIEFICPVHNKVSQKPLTHLHGKGCPICARGSKLTTQDFINQAVIIHDQEYDYSKAIYLNNRTKVEIICRIHGPFWQNPDSHINGGNGCYECYGNEIITNEIFAEKGGIIHNNKYDYSLVEYVSSNKDVIIICPDHGPFEQKPGHHIHCEAGCQKCIGRHDTISYIAEAQKVHGNKYDYSETVYDPHNLDIRIICPQHGPFTQHKKNHLQGYGCRPCGIEFNANNQRKPLEQLISEYRNVHGDRYDYSQVVACKSNKDKIIIICKKHGPFSQGVLDHLQGKGCQKCGFNISKPEVEWLNYLNIPEEYRHARIKVNGKRYDPDAYDPNTNTIYEFNGDFWHGNPQLYKADDINECNGDSFGILYNKTIEKEQRLKQSGFNIISIWEYDWKLLKKTSQE